MVKKITRAFKSKEGLQKENLGACLAGMFDAKVRRKKGRAWRFIDLDGRSWTPPSAAPIYVARVFWKEEKEAIFLQSRIFFNDRQISLGDGSFETISPTLVV